MIVKVTVDCAADEIVTLGGLKLHVASDGKPEQLLLLKLSVPVKPFAGLIVKLIVPVWPRRMLTLFTSGTKSNVGACELRAI